MFKILGLLFLLAGNLSYSQIFPVNPLQPAPLTVDLGLDPLIKQMDGFNTNVASLNSSIGNFSTDIVKSIGSITDLLNTNIPDVVSAVNGMTTQIGTTTQDVVNVANLYHPTVEAFNTNFAEFNGNFAKMNENLVGIQSIARDLMNPAIIARNVAVATATATATGLAVKIIFDAVGKFVYYILHGKEDSRKAALQDYTNAMKVVNKLEQILPKITEYAEYMDDVVHKDKIGSYLKNMKTELPKFEKSKKKGDQVYAKLLSKLIENLELIQDNAIENQKMFNIEVLKYTRDYFRAVDVVLDSFEAAITYDGSKDKNILKRSRLEREKLLADIVGEKNGEARSFFDKIFSCLKDNAEAVYLNAVYENWRKSFSVKLSQEEKEYIREWLKDIYGKFIERAKIWEGENNSCDINNLSTIKKINLVLKATF